MDLKVIEEFPDYSISSDGQVVNNNTGRLLALTINQRGVCQVGLVKDGTQHKRSVALLVAKAFLDPPALEAFNTPIHLDGCKLNNRVDNLMWRPRWFAVRYQKQFEGWRGPQVPHRIIEINTKMKFKSSWHAAKQFGLLDRDVAESIEHRTYVWPTYQQFRILE